MQPAIVWAQNKQGFVLVTVKVHDCIEPEVNITETNFSFKGWDDTKENHYDVVIELFANVDVGESKYVVRPRAIEIKLKKQDNGVWWTKLYKGDQKLHYVTVDFDKWVDSSDDEPGHDFGWGDGPLGGFSSSGDESSEDSADGQNNSGEGCDCGDHKCDCKDHDHD